ncbi:hypothetical protein HMSSN139_25730 [Paenibacillus sp. HMSSN-139]|nr:hypothetical protein HMSSN139_25730 [Paenibacillus sp. HMSSN-139]
MKVQKAEFLNFRYRARFGGLRAPLLVPPHTLVEEDSGGGDSVSKISKEALNAINKKGGQNHFGRFGQKAGQHRKAVNDAK